MARVPGGKPSSEGLMFGLPVGKSRILLAIDAQRSNYTGLYIDDTKLQDSPHARRGSLLSATGSKELEIAVRATGVKVTSDGKKVIEWTGNPDRATSIPGIAAPKRRLWFGGRDQGYRFENLQLEALAPSSFSEPEPLGADGKLLSIIDVTRDARIGEWTMTKNGLSSPGNAPSRLRIPAPVPSRYFLSARVERKLGSKELYLGLLVGGRPCAISIDDDQMRQAGLDLLDGKRSTDALNLVARRYATPLLPPNQPVDIRCLVLPDTILVACGDKDVIRWHGDPRRLSESAEVMPANDSTADHEQLWLGSGGSIFQVRGLELKTLDEVQAQAVTKSFSGVFPLTLQRELPLAAARQWLAEQP
jgi:hypothetical protein